MFEGKSCSLSRAFTTVSSCSQCGHLAIAHIQQSHLPQRLLSLLNGWHIQAIIGPLPGDNRDPQGQCQRVKGRQLDLHLWQVWAVILAMTKLKQAIWSGVNIATDRGAIYPHPPGVQIVDTDQVLTQVPLEGLPLLIGTQVIQHRGQAVITEIQAARLLPQAGLQAVQTLVRPGFNVIEPMVAFREDVTQPNHADYSQAETLPVPMSEKMLIQ